MRKTDYDRLAKDYDAPWRTNVAPDARLGRLMEQSSSAPFRVLDVGCGTGAWLLSQSKTYTGTAAEFHGIEPSAGMLALARAKNISAQLTQTGAESIPYQDGLFDYIITRFAYHHYEDKARAFDEIVRVLRPGGTFVIYDMAPERMKNWLVYQFFPRAYELDMERFLPLERLQHELEMRGCSVTNEMNDSTHEINWDYVLGFASGRGTSSLQILSEDEFQAGLQRIRECMAADPQAKITNGGYGGDLLATKSS